MAIDPRLTDITDLEIDRNYKIVDGPSKFDLMVELFDRRNYQYDKHVNFTIVKDGQEEVFETTISKVEHDHSLPNSPDAWLIGGFLQLYAIGVRFNCAFNTRTREGYLKLDL